MILRYEGQPWKITGIIGLCGDHDTSFEGYLVNYVDDRNIIIVDCYVKSFSYFHTYLVGKYYDLCNGVVEK